MVKNNALLIELDKLERIAGDTRRYISFADVAKAEIAFYNLMMELNNKLWELERTGELTEAGHNAINKIMEGEINNDNRC